MSKSENFRNYPKILEIENDGKILALDKNGRVNSEFYTHKINDDDFYNVFGTTYDFLHDKYVNEDLSRYKRNKETYNNQEDVGKVKAYDGRYNLNEDDLYHNKKLSQKPKRGLIIIIVIALLIVFTIMFMNNKQKNEEQQNQQVTTNQQLKQENEQLQQDMNDTQNKLEDSQTNEQQTQQDINNLQNRIDDLKNNQNSNTNQDAIKQYQDGISKLQDAQNSKAAGNYEEVKDKVKGLDKYIDKEQLTEDGKNAWTNFKGWINENKPF